MCVCVCVCDHKWLWITSLTNSGQDKPIYYIIILQHWNTKEVTLKCLISQKTNLPATGILDVNQKLQNLVSCLCRQHFKASHVHSKGFSNIRLLSNIPLFKNDMPTCPSQTEFILVLSLKFNYTVVKVSQKFLMSSIFHPLLEFIHLGHIVEKRYYRVYCTTHCNSQNSQRTAQYKNIIYWNLRYNGSSLVFLSV